MTRQVLELGIHFIWKPMIWPRNWAFKPGKYFSYRRRDLTVHDGTYGCRPGRTGLRQRNKAYWPGKHFPDCCRHITRHYDTHTRRSQFDSRPHSYPVGDDTVAKSNRTFGTPQKIFHIAGHISPLMIETISEIIFRSWNLGYFSNHSRLKNCTAVNIIFFIYVFLMCVCMSLNSS